MKFTAFFLLFLYSLSLFASQPSPRTDLNYSVVFDLAHKAVILKVKNLSKDLNISIQSAANSTIKITPKTFNVKAGQNLAVSLEIAAPIKDGQNILILTSKTDDVPEPGPGVHQPVVIHGTEALPQTLGDMIARHQSVRANRPSEISNTNIDGYNYRQPIAKKVIDLSSTPVNLIERLPYADTGTYLIDKVKQLPDFNFDFVNGVAANVAFPPSNPQPMPVLPPAATPAGYVVKGKMAMKLSDGKIVAAWGWTVRVWQDQGTAGGWRYLGGTSVRANGDWQLGIDPANVQTQKPLSIEFIALNRFFQVREANGTPWTWNTNVTLNESPLNVGSRVADLSNEGEVPGLGEIYLAGAALWTKLAKNGINAVKEVPYNITFPNQLESGKCIFGNPQYAWSCSYWLEEGDIYLIPEHAKPEVVIHELGHAINSYFWNEYFPPGAGGEHWIKTCGKNGMALTEGFADFLAMWVLSDTRSINHESPFGAGIDNEVKLRSWCANSMSEFVVMQQLWDMIDYHNDGQYTKPLGTADTFAFKNDHMPVTLYLSKKQDTLHTFHNDLFDWTGQLTNGVGSRISRAYHWNISDLQP